jgi:hypothetical protein
MMIATSSSVHLDFRIVDDTPVLDASLEYLRAGLMPVFVHSIASNGGCTCHSGLSCKSRGKHPVRKNWILPPKDEIELRDEYARLKFTPNVGIILGEQRIRSYLVAIDVDNAARLIELEEKYGKLPNAPECEGGRGPRKIFRIPDVVPRARLKNVTGFGGKPGVDVKAKGGQVVVAPSRHHSGKIYRWTRLGEVPLLPVSWADEMLEDVKPPEFLEKYTPETLAQDERAKNRAHAYLQKAVTEEAARLAHMPEGTRNDYLYRKTVRLLALANDSYSISRWEYVIRQMERAALASGLGSAEVRRTLASAEKYVLENNLVSRPRPLTVYEKKEATAATPVAPPPVSAPVRIELDPDPQTGRPASIAGNVLKLLLEHPDWNGGPRADEYSDFIYWKHPRPAPLGSEAGAYSRDVDCVAIQSWCFRYGLRMSLENIDLAIRAASKKNPIDSLKIFVEKLPEWDGVSRLDRWLSTYLGCKDNAYYRATGRSWLRACVERALRPGLLVDVAPVLIGPQGSNKNRAIETLFRSERIDAPWMCIMGKFKPDSLEFKKMSTTRWIIHDDEFKARSPKFIDEIKSWVSMFAEQYQAKYEMDLSVRRRRALLICSSNDKEVFYDTTGNRRWWLWEVGKIDVDALARDRLQLFAEAKESATWREGLDWDAVEAHNKRAEIVDPMRDQLLRLANEPVQLHNGDVLPPLWTGWATSAQLAEWLKIPPAHADQGFAVRLGRIVLEINGLAKRVGRGAGCIRFYRPPPPINPAELRDDLNREEN